MGDVWSNKSEVQKLVVVGTGKEHRLQFLQGLARFLLLLQSIIACVSEIALVGEDLIDKVARCVVQQQLIQIVEVAKSRE
jgi:hypothetical protein